MTKRFGWLVGLLVIACLVALAADIDGKWTATTQGKQGLQTQTLTLKAQGDKLTGSIEGGRGGPVALLVRLAIIVSPAKGKASALKSFPGCPGR
jgi:hypothetical protein